MVVASALLVVLLLVIFSRYRVKQKANRALEEKQEEINQQNQVLERMVEEEKKITGEKDKLLQEKDWLMREINHRVKNNLQVVMSLLHTQTAYLKDEAALSAIQESEHRIHAISLIHRKLYQSDRQLTVIDMGLYIKEVTEYLSDGLDDRHRIVFGLFVDPIELDVVQAVPTGLIINEAVTNSVKYAFPDGRKGQINIYMFRSDSGEIELHIVDNGVGLPEGFDWEHTESLGMSLMRGLTRQLDGRFEVLGSDGLTIRVVFRAAPVIG
jgi:two-component sensor histidine kinase